MRQLRILKQELEHSRKKYSELSLVFTPLQALRSSHAPTSPQSATEFSPATRSTPRNASQNPKSQPKHAIPDVILPLNRESSVATSTPGLRSLVSPRGAAIKSANSLSSSGNAISPASFTARATLPGKAPSIYHAPLHSINQRHFCSSSGPFQTPQSQVGRYVGYAFLLLGSALAAYYSYFYPPKSDQQTPQEEHTVTNWSGTHEAKTKMYLQPESLEDLEAIVKDAHKKKQKIRPVGSGLSPNGIGLSDEGMVNLALMDEILNIDKEKKTVTVQAGARVEQVVEALKPHGLTLQNFASIKEQQIGGFIQVGAHGTGATIPPVDDHVLNLKLVTPALGTLELSPESSADLFYLARCGLGALGVVAEVTLQCVSMHRLLEYTFVTNIKEIRKKHKKWLQENRHLRYMWIPYTDAVVVVQSNPLPEGKEPPKYRNRYEPTERLKHVRVLYKKLSAEYRSPSGVIEDLQGNPGLTSDEKIVTAKRSQKTSSILSEDELSTLSFTELRDSLLALDPLNKDLVIQVNKAEAEYWKRSEGYRVGWSHEILGFDCGGQQWVSEVCFPTGTLKSPSMKDIAYMDEILRFIKRESFPAPAPIEQRWTASSRSSMSPASSSSVDDLFSWVGIIMYLPTIDEDQREAITRNFFLYREASQKKLWDAYGAVEHWAKIEVPGKAESLEQIRDRLRRRFPVDFFNKARRDLDPHGILSNKVIDQLFPREEN